MPKHLKRLIYLNLFFLSILFAIRLFEPLRVFFLEILFLLLPFIVGFIIAYILVPYVDYFRKKGVPKVVAIGIVLGVGIYILLFLGANLVPLIFTQVEELKENWPIIIENIKKIFSGFTKGSNDLDLSTIGPFLSGVTKYSNLFFLSPILTVYFLFGYDDIKEYLKKNTHGLLKDYLRELNQVFRSYFNGVILVVFLLALFSSLLFSLIGINYSVVFGIIIGITNIIPFIGPYIGALIVFLYAYTLSPLKAVYAFLIVMGLQTIESNWITPHIQSKKLKKSPFILLLGFVFFSKYAGILGMLLSSPLISLLSLGYKYLNLYFLKKKNLNF